MNLIGIMQGRLSAPRDGRIQSFPIESWQREFELARQAGLACLEWVYEESSETQNPLRTEAGLATICRLSQDTGVKVLSICADYYMTQQLLTQQGTVRTGVVSHLRWLIGRAGLLGAHHVVLPWVDASSLRSLREPQAVVPLLQLVLPAAEESDVELHLETDLAPEILGALMQQLDHPRIRVTYDMGNSACLGYDPATELPAIRAWLGSVHVKDRLLGGGSVPLGHGAVDFPGVFRELHDMGYQGCLILQAARDPQLTEVALAARNRQLIEEHLLAAATH